jgi:hypothetical protein
MDFPANDLRNGPTFLEKIDRHEWSQLGCRRYVREYVDPLKPVIITGALEHLPARSKWTFDFFHDHYGHLPLEVDGRHLSMAQLIAEVSTSTPHAAAPYLRNYSIKLLPGALQADIAPMPSWTGPNWLDSYRKKRRVLTISQQYPRSFDPARRGSRLREFHRILISERQFNRPPPCRHDLHSAPYQAHTTYIGARKTR